MQTIRFDKAFSTGIRQDDRNPVNTQALVECRNVAATEFGLRPFRTLTQPITDAAITAASIVKGYPWPQLFRGKGVTLLCDEDAIFSVTESPTGNWTIGAVTLYDFTTYNWDTDAASTGTIPAGGKDWHFVDLWDSWMLFNGNCVIFRLGFSAKVFIQTSVTINTGASYQDGRVFYGGFNSSNVNSLADWTTYLRTSAVVGDYPAELLRAGSNSSVGSNWVWWSSIGMPDLLRFFSLNFMIYGSLAATPTTEWSADNPMWLDLARRAESGNTPLPYSGDVLKMAQLGGAMICYGATGVHALVPVNTEYAKTFGHQQLIGPGTRVGVAQGTNVRAAAGGDETVQAFIDESRDLWIVEPNLRATRLGYRHLFTGLTDLMVHYDPHEQEFHFSALDRCYRLSSSRGMARAPQIPTTVSFGRSSSASAAVGIVSADASPTAVTVQTEWFDGDIDGVPQVLKVHLIGSSGWTVTPKFYRTPTDSEQTSTSVAVDGRNAADLHLSGVRFSLVFTHADRTAARMDSLDVYMDDGTARRSIKKWQV